MERGITHQNPFTRIGNKSNPLPIILSVFPKEFDRYIEIFGGSGAVLLAEFLPPEETDSYEMRHIASVFNLVQELMIQSSSWRGGNQFQELMQLLPGDHKAKWLAGPH